MVKKLESILALRILQDILTRIYGFLAERFLSYWFQKNYKVKELPIIFKDITDYKDL